MPAIRCSNVGFALFLAFVTTMLGCTAQTRYQQAPPGPSPTIGALGAVEFPTTCSPRAHSHFIRGLAALHSFWYPVALDEFRAATRIDPGCMIGYWGEAMAHNHPIWGDPQDTDAARNVIEKIARIPEVTAREHAYLDAVKILYGEGGKVARDNAYAMEKIYREYPNDAEAALFYALALMGAGRSDDRTGLQKRLRAGEIASQIFRKKPDHPGAAHYVIHAYDDPKHAPLALEAARRYAQIAPAAPHALHMPSHIFVQLGMWTEAAASNEASWTASDRWVKANNLPISERDYHSLHWLQYAYLQQGRYTEAKELLDDMRESLARFSREDMRNLMYGTYIESSMAAAYLIATQQWNNATSILALDAPRMPDEGLDSRAQPYEAFAALATSPALFARGLAAAMTGLPEAEEIVSELQELSREQTRALIPFIGELRQAAGIQALEISAVVQAARGRVDAAIDIMEEAARKVDAMPPSPGPPPLIKPVHELFGEILLRAERHKEAAVQFTVSLSRHPNRARSLLGAGRAFAQSGDMKRAD